MVRTVSLAASDGQKARISIQSFHLNPMTIGEGWRQSSQVVLMRWNCYRLVAVLLDDQAVRSPNCLDSIMEAPQPVLRVGPGCRGRI